MPRFPDFSAIRGLFAAEVPSSLRVGLARGPHAGEWPTGLSKRLSQALFGGRVVRPVGVVEVNEHATASTPLSASVRVKVAVFGDQGAALRLIDLAAMGGQLTVAEMLEWNFGETPGVADRLYDQRGFFAAAWLASVLTELPGNEWREGICTLKFITIDPFSASLLYIDNCMAHEIALANADSPQTDEAGASRPSRKANANARMLDILQKETEARHWTAAQWAQRLDYKSESTIKETPTWKELAATRQTLKFERQASAAARQPRRR